MRPTKDKFDWSLAKIGLKMASGQLLFCALLIIIQMKPEAVLDDSNVYQSQIANRLDETRHIEKKSVERYICTFIVSLLTMTILLLVILMRPQPVSWLN